MKNTLILTMVFAGMLDLYSQTAVSNGALITINSGAIVHVNGGVEFNNSTILQNDGSLTTTINSSFANPGTLKIGIGSSLSGNGQYFVEQDWINAGTFTAANSTVTLFGSLQQFIIGPNLTEFNNLTLTGTGNGINRKKTLQGIDSRTSVAGVLTINNRELETQTQSFYVLNPNVSAVGYDNTFGAEGFVSSSGNGYLYRATNSISPYVFPTGSSLGTLRFRPIELTPQNIDAAQYAVRLNNIDPNNQGFNRSQNDGSMCSLNPNFYHSIERISGAAATDIKVFYITGIDGAWTGLAQWINTSSNWNDMVSATPGVSGGFATETKAGWGFVNPGHPYILSKMKVAPPVINCIDVCENSVGNVFSVTGIPGNYQWTVPSNASITSGQGTNTLTVNWTTGSGTITVVEVDATGCSSLPTSCTPTVNPTPNANFTYVSNGLNFSFTDQTPGSSGWAWDFGDGSNAAINNPIHDYISGSNFNVTLTVTDNNGCVGTITQMVEIFEELVIPNIITPNNDGTNDEFSFSTSGLNSVEIIIANRWGNIVYQSNDPSKFWDGKSNGELVSEGVYFYTIKAKTITKEYNYSGNVTVIRQ